MKTINKYATLPGNEFELRLWMWMKHLTFCVLEEENKRPAENDEKEAKKKKRIENRVEQYRRQREKGEIKWREGA